MLTQLRARFQAKFTRARGRRTCDHTYDRIYEALIAPQQLGSVLRICNLPDDFSGRFEAMSLLMACYLHKSGARAEVERALVGALVADIDNSFRENSLGDATVKRHAIHHAAALYGRLRAYAATFGDSSRVRTTLKRNLYGDRPTAVQEQALPQVLPQIFALLGAMDNEGYRESP